MKWTNFVIAYIKTTYIFGKLAKKPFKWCMNWPCTLSFFFNNDNTCFKSHFLTEGHWILYDAWMIFFIIGGLNYVGQMTIRVPSRFFLTTTLTTLRINLKDIVNENDCFVYTFQFEILLSFEWRIEKPCTMSLIFIALRLPVYYYNLVLARVVPLHFSRHSGSDLFIRKQKNYR